MFKSLAKCLYVSTKSSKDQSQDNIALFHNLSSEHIIQLNFYQSTFNKHIILLSMIKLLISSLLLIGAFSAVEADLMKTIPGYGNFTTNIYSGYLNTSSSSRQLHYVFVESIKGKNNSDPVTLWLNGGPGCSSMLGFLQEIGPYFLEDGLDYKPGDNLTLNNYSWHTASNLLFIESPAGVGFSYNLETKYEYNDANTASDALSAVLHFFHLYSEYLSNPFWIAGESYAGKYIPDLAVLIDKNSFDNHINLKGILVGNGVMNFRNGEMEKSTIQYMIDHEFVDPELINYWKTSCRFDEQSAGCNYFISRYELDTDDLNPYNIYDYCYYNATKVQESPVSQRSEMSILKSINEFLRKNENIQSFRLREGDQRYGGSAPCLYLDGVYQYFNAHKKEYNAKFADMEWNGPCANNISYHIDLDGSMKSYTYLLSRLNKYHIFLYNGDWDNVVTYSDTIKNLQKLNLEPSHAYSPWFTDGQHSGFMQNWGGLHFIIFKGASHMVPQTKRPDALAFFKGVVTGTTDNLLTR